MQAEPVEFILAERQGVPLVFICHFLLRIHQQMMPLLKAELPELEWWDWQLMPNKFPGDIHGDMSSIFHAIMSGAAWHGLVVGNIRIVNFVQSKDDHGSLLADNIAGMLTGKLNRGERAMRRPVSHGKGASIQWEVWDNEPT